MGKLAQRVLGPQNMPNTWLLLLVIITALLIHGSVQVWTSQAFLSSESFPNSTRLIALKSPETVTQVEVINVQKKGNIQFENLRQQHPSK